MATSKERTTKKPRQQAKSINMASEQARNVIQVYQAAEHRWEEITASTSEVNPGDDEASRRRRAFQSVLQRALQMQHVVVLAGSGTSLGSVKGPSMGDLWELAVKDQPIDVIREAVGYKTRNDREDIEDLLSRCEAYLVCGGPRGDEVTKFRNHARAVILKACNFLPDHSTTSTDPLRYHEDFLRRLSRRRARDSRLRLFTTNYDLCFENAASMCGLIALDGFSFGSPRLFDPRNFQYDVVHRNSNGDGGGQYLTGVFHLYKLHGSVDWERHGPSQIVRKAGPCTDSESAVIVYPASAKYQQSYVQPHLELMSQYLAALREPNTCVIAIGFGFNDDHLSEPLLAALKTNPHFKLIAVSPSAKADSERTPTTERPNYWQKFAGSELSNLDVCLIGATFDEFVQLLPDLKALSPAESFVENLREIVGTSNVRNPT